MFFHNRVSFLSKQALIKKSVKNSKFNQAKKRLKPSHGTVPFEEKENAVENKWEGVVFWP
jgi:hypothetical protein